MSSSRGGLGSGSESNITNEKEIEKRKDEEKEIENKKICTKF